jgi:hypothetical protein
MEQNRFCLQVLLFSILALTIAGFAGRGISAQSTESPNPPVIFLHYDYMAPRWWEPSSGNFAPDPDSIGRVVESFRRQGITLLIDPQHTEIPYSNYLSMRPISGIFGGPPCGPPVCADFYDLKAQYFHPHGNLPWHYAIFADVGYDPFDGFVGGQAELPGYNFMVTLRHAASQKCFFGTPIDFCMNHVAAQFMHELGHNLDLHHGGDDDENYKINYISVMNYQFPRGIYYLAPGETYQFGTWIGQPPLSEFEHIAGTRLDYSGGVSATLDENHLDETVGVGGPEKSNDVTFYWSCASPRLQPCIQGFIHVAAAPFDWNNDGIIETDAAADINYDGNLQGDLLLTEMRGFDDWAHVKQFLRTPRYLIGMSATGAKSADPVVPNDQVSFGR